MEQSASSSEEHNVPGNTSPVSRSTDHLEAAKALSESLFQSDDQDNPRKRGQACEVLLLRRFCSKLLQPSLFILDLTWGHRKNVCILVLLCCGVWRREESTGHGRCAQLAVLFTLSVMTRALLCICFIHNGHVFSSLNLFCVYDKVISWFLVVNFVNFFVT